MKRSKSDLRKSAKERVKKMFKEAELAQDKDTADLLVEKARRTAMKHKLKMPREYKRRFCKHCYSYLIPGKNCRVRTREGKVIYCCKECKKYMRFPID
ncbi:MAG: ribonuclease P [Nanoarchaeota archaeon]|nr:ribonuclease P [Nanoarchaeota archaeon]MBU1703922.1 ribonuclease P [Nanoarchaeota archaeon]